MEGKKTFIGYDLGDGETITDLAVLDAAQIKDRIQTLFTAMTMPDCNDPGKAVPTVFGYDGEGNIAFTSSILAAPEDIHDIRINFKRCPSDLIPNISENRKEEIINLLEQGWPAPEECPELHSKKMREFSDAVIRFTNAIFNDEIYKKRVHDAALDSDEIVFCVGHPTRWTEFDVAVYSGILRLSVLGAGAYAGLPTSMIMAAESRAAFLYVRDKATSQVLQPGTCALLIDVGSSTIDLTAMTSDSRNHQYNSGSNYLGARSVDFVIRQWYLDKLREDEEDWNVYQALIQDNPAMEQALTLSCRMAKEKVYSTAAGLARIYFADFHPQKITKADVDKIVGQMPIGEILQSSINLPAKTVAAMGQKDWKELFEEFLQERKAEMTAQGITISRIIMTGSASKMPFVPEIVAKVFSEVPEDGILNDMNPSRSISMGLALVGPSNEKSVNFQTDLNEMMHKELPEVISADIPQLADSLSAVLVKKVNGIVKARMQQWRRSEIKTLEDMTKLIRQDCSEENLNRLLQNDQEYNEAIKKWTVDVVGQDIAVKLHALCERYGVGEISLESLNVMKVSSLNIGSIRIDPTADIADMLAGTISVIAGVVAAIILPSVLGIIIGLISWISAGLAVFLLEILLALPGIGWAILLGVAGIAVVKAANSGLEGAKKQLSDKLQRVDLPDWVRKRMTDEKLEQQLEKANLRKDIRASFLEENAKNQMVDSVTKGLQKQVKKRAEDIKYVIESI